ncbi:peptidoglycan editing factor PgeF [Breoghania sp.]|uniref:peptidoglycan editing factor PgeF n=1 Tax=Breoghania sp. TaxID=2065378 RepID=UPI0026372A41|nr:peptidoglycan editing factor PgeF [Breoghania sp.]MDJ0931569.1 peptidoglycan editing factor PgeF [Breoghania sp.]
MISAPELADLPGIDHGFFTRNGGVSEGIYQSLNIGLGSDDTRSRVEENRAHVARTFGLEADRLVNPHQHHSADAVTVRTPWKQGEGPRADAMVTDQPDILLGISTTDCGPVLFANPEARVVGAAHAGWRGALTGILESTIEAMVALDAKRSRIIAVLGPTISAAAYEVGSEFVERFTEADEGNGIYFRPNSKADHAMFDLLAYIVDRLEQTGIAHATSLQRCTYSEEETFFSYRRTTHRGEGDYGRQVSAICIRED